MVLALNILLPIVLIALLVIAIRYRKWWPVLLAAVFFILYTLAQPSYLPKGTVKSFPNAEFKVNDSPIVDRQLKPKSPQEYDIKRNKDLQAIDEKLERLEMKSKTEKE